MGTIDEYLTTLDPADTEVVGHAYDVARRVVPEAEQGLGYGMPALTYKGKSLLSVMRTKQHFGIYPFSARVVETSEDLLEGVDHAKGSIRCAPGSFLSDEALAELVSRRKNEIDG